MIEREQETSASAEQVWAVLSDVERWPDLLPTVTEVRPLGGTSGLALGHHFTVKQPKLPVAEYVVTELTPGRSFTWTADSRGVRTTATHTIEGDAATMLRLSIAWSGPLRVPVRLGYGRLTLHYLETELTSMCAAAEAG